MLRSRNKRKVGSKRVSRFPARIPRAPRHNQLITPRCSTEPLPTLIAPLVQVVQPAHGDIPFISECLQPISQQKDDGFLRNMWLSFALVDFVL
jgi:hypothetical protein